MGLFSWIFSISPRIIRVERFQLMREFARRRKEEGVILPMNL